MLFTLADTFSHETLVRKSRFLALARPLTEPGQAQEFLQEFSHPQATHNCWAWRFGQQYRFFDDGEPGGTAGRPILQAIDSQSCDRVIVMVTRWFGGIKLGTGGLVRAYGGCAAECLRLAGKQPLQELRQVVCTCAYPDMDLAQARLLDAGASIVDTQYQAEGVVWQLQAALEDLDTLQEMHRDLTRGQGTWQLVSTDD